MEGGQTEIFWLKCHPHPVLGPRSHDLSDPDRSHRISEIYKQETGVLVWLSEGHDRGEGILLRTYDGVNNTETTCFGFTRSSIEKRSPKPTHGSDRTLEGALESVQKDLSQEYRLALVSLL